MAGIGTVAKMIRYYKDKSKSSTRNHFRRSESRVAGIRNPLEMASPRFSGFAMTG